MLVSFRQGFEADYVGVIWGEDLIWRNRRWVVNASAIMDNIGNNQSLRKLADSGDPYAKALLINRILLSRGIKGTSIYFEDQETFEHMKEIMEYARGISP